jgi:TonB family protein
MDWAFCWQLLWRSTLILGAGEILRRFQAHRSAAFRHRLVLLSFVLLVFLPIFSSLLPEIPLPLGIVTDEKDSVTTRQAVFAIELQHRSHPVNWILLIWIAGGLIAITPVVTGMFSSKKIVNRARRPDGADWNELLIEILGQRQLRRKPEILISRELIVPLTCGVFRPKILLPEAAQRWDVPRRNTVLLHEVAHVRRRDVVAQVWVHVIAALWWFQPLVWTQRRILRTESELACDAEAIASGIRASRYAEELLALAKTSGRTAISTSVGISMWSRGSDLESRLVSVLHPKSVLTTRTRIWTTFFVLAAISMAASTVTTSKTSFDEQGGSFMKRSLFSGLAASISLSAATISGVIYDPSGAAIPEAKIQLYNPESGAKQETVSGADGKFALENTPAGQYILRVEKPGFSSILREFDLKADSKIERGLTMSLGRQVKGTAGGSSQTTGSNPIRVGGAVLAANLIHKKDPVYPETAKAAGVQGIVEIEAVVSKDGVPREIRVLSSPSDDLSQAALEAVGQWRYRPTLLNGNPVDVVTDISVNFTLSQ